MPVALSLQNITRRFGGVVALENASLDVERGTVHALLGENGAGKTTLMRVAFGLVQPDGGTIAVNGNARRFESPSAALAAGIGMVHQHFTLVPAMTVAENVALGGRGRFSPVEWAERVRSIGDETGLTLDPAARVSDLPVGAQQRAEIVKALARNVETLILDEPAAVLAPPEARDLLKWLRAFADAGHTVVLITHKLRDALETADNVTVLRRGRTVLTDAVRNVTEASLVAAMLGEERAVPRTVRQPDAPVPHASTVGSPVLRAEGVSFRDERGLTRVERATFAINAGELVGIAAIEGAGQRELLRLLAGRLAPTAGSVVAPERVGFVPEDRHADALMLDASLIENVALRDVGARHGRMPWASLASETGSIIAERNVRAGGAYSRARELSGGNQQKLVVGRELADNPRALVVENPTRGLDIRAAAAVHDALRLARTNGAAVVVYSSDLDEVLELADRVLVVSSGRVTEVERDRDAIGQAMLGVGAAAAAGVASPAPGAKS